jgi:hypothetical protein
MPFRLFNNYTQNPGRRQYLDRERAKVFVPETAGLGEGTPFFPSKNGPVWASGKSVATEGVESGFPHLFAEKNFLYYSTLDR